MKKKLLATVLCMAMLLTCLAGCGGEDKGDQGADGVKKIVYANGGQPESMEFVEGSRYAKYSVLKYNIYTGLTRISKDGTSEMGWADKYETSDDGLVWTFHIREDAKFSDGTDMTAHDWEETMKYYCAPKTAAQQTTLEEYVKNMGAYIAGECEWKDVGYKALDDRTLEITLENPCTYFLDIACTYVALPMHIVNENPNWNKTAETYVGNGPFRMVSLKDQVNVVLEKNPYYKK
ncbi:ABC transporter substrate-binding protein [Anaerovoracaceae bacterium 42-11]